MKIVSNSIEIDRSQEEVFRELSEIMNESKWNPRVLFVEQVTTGPSRVGARYRAQWQGGPVMDIETRRLEAPRVWETYADGKGLALLFRGEVRATGKGSLFTVTMQLRPKGMLRLMAPLLRRRFDAQQKATLPRIKAALETATVAVQEA